MLLLFNVPINLQSYYSLADNFYVHFLHPDIKTSLHVTCTRKHLTTHKAYRKRFHPLCAVTMAMEIIITFMIDHDKARVVCINLI